MTTQQTREALPGLVREYLEREGRTTGVATYRALNPPLSYVQFMVRYFAPIYAEIFGEAPGRARRSPRGRARRQKPVPESRIPLSAPQAVEIPAPVIRLKPEALVRLREQRARHGMESEAGRFSSEPLPDGRFRISLELTAADRPTHLFLTGFLHGVLFPETEG